MSQPIKIGESLPDAEFLRFQEGSMQTFCTSEVFGEGLVLVIGVVNAFGPICSRKHLSEFIPYAKELVENWLVKRVVCISASDPFCLQAWAEKMQIKESMQLFTDKNADFARKTGLSIDLTHLGLGIRSTRYVMLVRDNKILDIRFENAPNDIEVTSKAAVQSWLTNYV